MAKKATAPLEPGEPQRTKHLNTDQCKAAAAKISVERRTHAADLAQYKACTPDSGNVGSFVPIWPADFDACVAKIHRLYHPEEAAIIIENLTA